MSKRHFITELVLIYVVLFGCIIYSACEKICIEQSPVVEQTDTCGQVKFSAEDKAQLDSFYTAKRSALRASDGYYRYVWIGDGFTGNKGAIFNRICDSMEHSFTYIQPYPLRLDTIRFLRINVNQSLNCKVSTIGLTSTLGCSVTKIINVLENVDFDRAIVFSYGKPYGGNYNWLSVLGVGTLVTNPYCNVLDAIVYKAHHEDKHGVLGIACGSDNIGHLQGTIMGSASNGGCALVGLQFNSCQQQIILTDIDN